MRLTSFSFVCVLSLFASLGVHAADAVKEPYCTWKTENGVAPQLVGKADARLNLTADEVQRSVRANTKWGLSQLHESASGERLLVQRRYLMNYDSDLRTSTWTSHFMQKSDFPARNPFKRPDAFRADPRLTEAERSDCADYEEPIFDQGHIVPVADAGGDQLAAVNTFLMSNMAPQHCAFNRGPWQVLEGLIRKWVKEYDKTWVITGAILDRDNNGLRDPDDQAKRMEGKRGRRVAIPTHFYKIVTARVLGRNQVITIVLPNVPKKIPNADVKKYLTEHIQTVAWVEARTGQTFFPRLRGQTATKFKNAKASALWPYAGSLPRSLDSRCKATYPEW